MINRLSKLSKISKVSSFNEPLRFNSSLPISIEVLKELPLNRYKLLLGNREFTTKSKKKLKAKERYWGDFSNTKDGVILISNLVKKPTFLQKETNFLDFEFEFLFNKLKKTYFKDWILDGLEGSSKIEFKIFATMLLALKNGVIHLPLKVENELCLIQLKENKFYMAQHNLGPICGVFENKKLKIDILFQKSFYFLKESLKGSELQIDFNLKESISPIFEKDTSILDIKG